MLYTIYFVVNIIIEKHYKVLDITMHDLSVKYNNCFTGQRGLPNIPVSGKFCFIYC
jgi:hypothetical protein